MVWQIDKGIYYEIIENLMTDYLYSLRKTENYTYDIHLTSANDFKNIVSLLVKDCSSPKEIKTIANASVEMIAPSEEVTVAEKDQDIESENLSEAEDIEMIKKYVSEMERDF